MTATPAYNACCATYHLDPSDPASLDAIVGRLDQLEGLARRTTANERYWYRRYMALVHHEPEPVYEDLLKEAMAI